MAPESRRFLVAIGIALLLGVPFAGAYLLAARTESDLVATAALSGLLFLDVWCLVYVLATVHAFAGAPAEVLRTLIRPSSGRPKLSSLWATILRGGSDGPLLAVVFAAVALVAAAVLPRIDRLVPSGSERAVLLVLSVSAVVLCWTVLAVGFAVHYIRLDVRHSGLQFPGSEPPQFLDYLYFAVSVATTFGTTDVNVTDRLLRRTVTAQAVLASVFNTVILALVIAALSP
jgi:Protein of unknown function (DUF1345)